MEDRLSTPQHVGGEMAKVEVVAAAGDWRLSSGDFGPVGEVPWLMSLALDEQITADEAARFEQFMAEHPELNQEWQTWQFLDWQFRNTPVVMPQANFVGEFERRLAQRERRRKLWLGVFIAAVSVSLWGSLLLGSLALGAYVLLNQAYWLGSVMHLIVYWSVNLTNWFSSAVAGLEAIWSMPQMREVGAAYVVTAVLTLVLWTQLLRRTVQVPDNGSTV